MRNILELILALMIITNLALVNKDNSYRNLVPSSGQSRGLDDYGCGPIRV
jgi:hypothetical protein